MESDDLFSDLFVEEPTATDVGTPTADETAIEAAAPADDPSPGTGVPEIEQSPSETEAFDAEPGQSVEAQQAETGPPQIDWNHPELAALRQQHEAAQQKAQQFDGLRAALQQMRAQKAAQDFQNRLTDLADGDPERLQHLNAMVAQVATPAVQQAQQAIRERDQLGKVFSAYVVASKAHLDEETQRTLMGEMEALMAVDDPHLMERAAFGKRDTVRLYEQKLADKDRQLRDLQLQLAARSEIAQRGPADLVDGGGGGGAGSDWESRLDQAEDMDAYMRALFG